MQPIWLVPGPVSSLLSKLSPPLHRLSLPAFPWLPTCRGCLSPPLPPRPLSGRTCTASSYPAGTPASTTPVCASPAGPSLRPCQNQTLNKYAPSTESPFRASPQRLDRRAVEIIERNNLFTFFDELNT